MGAQKRESRETKAINKPAAYVFTLHVFFFFGQRADCLVEEFEYLPIFCIHENIITDLHKTFSQNK